jgi:hypothetical protein
MQPRGVSFTWAAGDLADNKCKHHLVTRNSGDRNCMLAEPFFDTTLGNISSDG